MAAVCVLVLLTGQNRGEHSLLLHSLVLFNTSLGLERDWRLQAGNWNFAGQVFELLMKAFGPKDSL